MPGVASLAVSQYYGHPRNVFWDLVEECLDIPRSQTYARRCRALASRGVALWDVLAECQRPGSLDSAIKDPEANDFAALFARQPKLAHIVLNGGKAQQLFRRFVEAPDAVRLHALPSTSPANTSRSKRAAWRRTWRLLVSPD